MSFFTELFDREILDGAMEDGDDEDRRPGVFNFSGWGLEARVGAESQEMIAAIREEMEAAEEELDPYFPYLHGVQDLESPADLAVSVRGDPYNLGEVVSRHFLTALTPDDPVPFSEGSGRLELAEAILAEPIAMRVIANRIWKEHFGTGIVDTPSNFGTAGERPTHPDLLEYLATTFVENGMSIKDLHRRIMLSSVYQLSTTYDDAAYAADSGNRFYWRANSKRLDAEQIRDSILHVADNLDAALGGPSEQLTPTFTRRTVYGKVSRYKLDEYLQLFDFPTPAISAEKRFTTTVPQQRLFMMNSDFVHLQAEAIADRVRSEIGHEAQVAALYRVVFGRAPGASELALGVEYLGTEPMLEYEEWKAEQQAAQEAVEEAPPEALEALEAQEALEASKASGEEVAEAEMTPPAADSPINMERTPESPTESRRDRTNTVDDDVAGVARREEERVRAETEIDDEPAADAMLAGTGGRGGRGAESEKVAYSATPLGRYAKVLLGSSEFLFIN
jgi:hypothetical protein